MSPKDFLNSNDNWGENTEQTKSAYDVTWEPALASHIQQGLLKRGDDKGGEPYMVALVGIPGSGKTVSSLLVANKLEEQGVKSMIMPHDGYHYPIDYLKTCPDAQSVIYRRGSPDTFDPKSLLRDLMRIKKGKRGEDQAVVSLPGFDHSKGDPEPNKHVFDRMRHKVVLCEGLYLLHDSDGWEPIRMLFDLTIFLESNVDNCMERVKIRNRCIPGYTPEEIDVRTDVVDRSNAMTVIRSKHLADVVVQSTTVAPVPPKLGFNKSRRSFVDLTEMATMEETSAQLQMRRKVRSFVDLTEMSRLQDFKKLPGFDTSSTPVKSQPTTAASFVGTWEADMAKAIFDGLASKPLNEPYMVAIVGLPGSGKSVSVLMLANELEKMNINPLIMPHDGYHYPVDYLMTFPDCEDKLYRRGAPDTFDPHALLRDLSRIKTNVHEDGVSVPGFDHARGDPEPDKHHFDRKKHSVVLCEGLYLLYNGPGWEEIPNIFDLKIFMDTDIDVCMERVKIRNQCVPGYTPEEIVTRTEKVDRVNALTVMDCKCRANVVVNSLAM